MTERPNIVDRFTTLMNQNIRGVQLGVYSVAFVGLAVAIRNVKLFTRFSRPADIPNRFINFRTKLKGTVERIEPVGGLLMVQHKPLISLPFRKVASLPVRISGVSFGGNGISWLQSVVCGQEISFVPVLKQKDCVQCEVTLQKLVSNKTKILNIGPALISVGFGQIAPIEKLLADNPYHQLYYNNLKAAESTALRKHLGNWYYLKMSQEFSQKMAHLFITLIKSKLNARKVPNLVTT